MYSNEGLKQFNLARQQNFLKWLPIITSTLIALNLVSCGSKPENTATLTPALPKPELPVFPATTPEIIKSPEVSENIDKAAITERFERCVAQYEQTLASRIKEIPQRAITANGYRLEAGLTVGHNHIKGIWLNSMVNMWTEIHQDTFWYKNPCDMSLDPVTFENKPIIKTEGDKDYLTSLFREYQEEVVIPDLRDSAKLMDGVLGSDYYSRLTEKQIIYMNKFVNIYPRVFATIKSPMPNPGVRIDRWEGIDPEPYMQGLLEVHKAMIDMYTVEHSQALKLAFMYDYRKYQNTIRMLADEAYSKANTPKGLVPLVLPFDDAGLFSNMDSFAYKIIGDSSVGFEGKLPIVYQNRLKAELTLYKNQNYRKVLIGIFANPPARLDLPESELDKEIGKQVDMNQALASDGLQPFVEMIVTLMMEMGANKGLGVNRLAREPLAKAPRTRASTRGSRASKELAKPKSPAWENPCVSSILTPWWQIALNNPDVFLGITGVAEARDCVPNINASNFRTEANKFLGKNIKVKNNSGIIGEIKIPRDYSYRLADNGKGVTFTSPDGLIEIKVMNPTTQPFEYPNGYIRKKVYKGIDSRTNKAIYTDLDLSGKPTSDLNKTHFGIK